MNLNSQKITGLADPTSAQEAATKNYVDAAIQGVKWKDAVRVATTGNITLSGTQTIDGISVVAGDRVAVIAQSAGAQNGIYVAASGAWSRAADADSAAEVLGMSFFVSEGTSNGNKVYTMTTDAPITLGTTALVFAQIGGGGVSYSNGTGITISGNTISIDTAVVARKYVAQIGNGSLTSITVTHNLGTKAVVVALRKVSTDEHWLTDVTSATTNTVTLGFAVAPTTNEFEVIVIG
ncbi:head decoration protein [Fibrisoma montanum]|uniref:Head decoration protein n=1 Tax=Fibrisoma montanum TaxID=2305895 RepID=A0A418M4Y5_9BACT|nr:head decoration protein [Fibrisoma montanum]